MLWDKTEPSAAVLRTHQPIAWCMRASMLWRQTWIRAPSCSGFQLCGLGPVIWPLWASVSSDLTAGLLWELDCMQSPLPRVSLQQPTPVLLWMVHAHFSEILLHPTFLGPGSWDLHIIPAQEKKLFLCFMGERTEQEQPGVGLPLHSGVKRAVYWHDLR